MSTVRQHLGLLWLLGRKLRASVTSNPQYDPGWAAQAALFVEVHLDELIALAGGAEIDEAWREHISVLPDDFPAPASPANTAEATGEREAFEAWAQSRGYWIARNEGTGIYKQISTHCAWEAWKAARALKDRSAIERHLNGSQP
jgi:hypothetical protein